MDTKKIFKWFWAWQDHHREVWLSQMSSLGWHFSSIDTLGLAFNFEKGAPREHTYRLDFRQADKEELNSYVDFIEEAGWEYLGSYTGWHYFRKPKESAETTEFFTDDESKVEKYKRLRGTLSIFYPFYFVIFFAYLDKYPLWFAIFLVSVFVLLILFVSASIIGVSLRIRELES